MASFLGTTMSKYVGPSPSCRKTYHIAETIYHNIGIMVLPILAVTEPLLLCVSRFPFLLCEKRLSNNILVQSCQEEQFMYEIRNNSHFFSLRNQDTTDYRTIEISKAWKRFMPFLVVNLFQASEIFL